MRSIAAVKSLRVTASAPRRVASNAASLTRLARSAPVKPTVSDATISRSTSGAMRILRLCTSRIWTRPAFSGRSTSTCRSKRPARNSAGSRRADQQYPFRHPAAEPAVTHRVLQKGDDLLQFGLGFVDPGNIGEGRLGVGLDIDLGLAAADRHQPAEPLLAGEAAVHEHPNTGEQRDGDHPGQEIAQKGALDRA